MKIHAYPSPNFNERPQAPDMIIIHHTHMCPAELALKHLATPESKVSAHYLIDKTGKIYGIVPEEKRAWHAGVSAWKDRENLNHYSIGIELDSMGDVFQQTMMEALVWLIRDIRTRYEIPDENILGHSDIAPQRKDDPSEAFDWHWLAEQGIGLWPEFNQAGGTLNISEAQKMLSSIGYAIDLTGVLDLQTENVLKAFQRHFYPSNVTGLLDEETCRRMEMVLTLYSS